MVSAAVTSGAWCKEHRAPLLLACLRASRWAVTRPCEPLMVVLGDGVVAMRRQTGRFSVEPRYDRERNQLTIRTGVSPEFYSSAGRRSPRRLVTESGIAAIRRRLSASIARAGPVVSSEAAASHSLGVTK